MKNDLFLKACRREPTPRTPVWLMRQAGRIIPDYRELRKTHDFASLMRNPELVGRVTAQPVEQIGVDAAIIFTDILIIPEAMGMDLSFQKNKGPVFSQPVDSQEAVDALSDVEPETDVDYLLNGIECAKRELDGSVPLIGFAGAPWTLAAYMIEGGGSKYDRTARKMLYGRPELFRQLLTRITDQTIRLLEAKVEAGVDALQLFDTSAGILSPTAYREMVVPHIDRIVKAFQDTDVPLIYFGKGAGFALDSIVDTGVDVVGLDWTVNLSEVRKRYGDRVALQGNLDPAALYSSPEEIRQHVRRVLREFGEGSGHIFNLGHGVYPDTKLDHVRAFVDAVKEESQSSSAR